MNSEECGKLRETLKPFTRALFEQASEGSDERRRVHIDGFGYACGMPGYDLVLTRGTFGEEKDVIVAFFARNFAESVFGRGMGCVAADEFGKRVSGKYEMHTVARREFDIDGQRQSLMVVVGESLMFA